MLILNKRHQYPDSIPLSPSGWKNISIDMISSEQSLDHKEFPELMYKAPLQLVMPDHYNNAEQIIKLQLECSEFFQLAPTSS
jgi:hypothetical protein